MKHNKALALVALLAFLYPPLNAATPATQASQGAEYEALMGRARAYNARAGKMDRWLMNCEHCFLVGSVDDPSDLLYDKAISFVREPGAIDLLFAHLLDSKVSDNDVLITSEFLIYAGEFYEGPGEQLPKSSLAQDVLTALQQGRFDRAQRSFPDAPLREKIAFAAHRALSNAPSTTQKTN